MGKVGNCLPESDKGKNIAPVDFYSNGIKFNLFIKKKKLSTFWITREKPLKSIYILFKNVSIL